MEIEIKLLLCVNHLIFTSGIALMCFQDYKDKFESQQSKVKFLSLNQ